MTAYTFPCPMCGVELLVRPTRWHRCYACGVSSLVPSVVRNTVPLAQRPRSICGELVQVVDEDDDAVCIPCYDANLRGGFPYERPLVAPVAPRWPTRRRDLAALDTQRWPLTGGLAHG